MEGTGGSSRKSNVNLTAERTVQGTQTWLSSRLDDHDDSLLDLSDDQEPQNTNNKLLLEFDSVSTTQDAQSVSETRGTVSPSPEIRYGDSVSTASVTGNEEFNRSSLDCDKQGSASVCVTGSAGRTVAGWDFFGSGDPTILSTNLPNFSHSRQRKMDDYSDSSQRRVYSDTSQTWDESSSLIPAARTAADAAATVSHAQLPASPQSNGTHSHYGVGDAVNTAGVGERLPDVTVRQPQTPSHPHDPAYSHYNDPDTTDSSKTTIGAAASAAVIASSSVSSGILIDYTHDTAAGDNMRLTQSPQRTQAEMHQNVMLDSFPPPPRGRGTSSDGDGVHCNGLVAEDLHCHSGTSRGKMNDKLARRQLLVVLVLCVFFMIGETVGGVLANSLALFTDVLHLASDLISYGISLLALYLSSKQATRRMTFGYYRAEVLGALFSVFIIWLVSGVLCYIAVERIMHEHYKDVKPDEMLITASLGVVFNLIMGFVLHSEKCCGVAKGHSKFGHGHSHSHSHSHSSPGHYTNNSNYEYEPLDVASRPEERGEDSNSEGEDNPSAPHRHKNINVRAAFIHVVGDIIQSLGVLVAALIIKLKEDEKYRLADPICTFLFSLLVLCTTINVMKDTLRIIMEGVPQDVDFEQLESVLQALDSVVAVHNLNVWALTMDRNALSVHLAIDGSRRSSEVLTEATKALKRHKFYHLTIQVEPYNHEFMSVCVDCQLPVK